MPKALYICYFGIREPLVQTQVLPYLRELVKIDDLRMLLVTFEPRSAVPELQSYGVARLQQELAEQGIDWHWLRYHKRSSVIATSWDIFRGTLFTWRFGGREKIDLVHARVHVPMLMAALARRFSRRKPKLLFDIRGFFPEEYVDAGIWPKGGWLYRMAKGVEKWLLKESDGFVVLTEKARMILFPESKDTGLDKFGRPVEVIPCCVDLRRFDIATVSSRSKMRLKLDVEDRYVMVYVGSFGGWYSTSETADLYGELKRKRAEAFALILTQGNPEMMEPLLRNHGYGSSDFLITQVLPAEIPLYLSAADVAVSFIKPCYSKQASSPTKNAEYLACGLPIIANSGVGDVDAQIREGKVGALVCNFERDDYIAALEDIDALGNIEGRCREVAKDQFDLVEVGGFRYRRLYKKLLSSKP